MATTGQYANIDKGIVGDKNQYQNIGGMRSRGVEASVNSNKKDKIYYGLAYAYTDAKFTKYDNFNLLLGNPYGNYTTQHYDLAGYDVPRVPNHTLNLNANYNVNNNLLLSTEYNFKSSHYADELNRFKVPAYGVVNLLANYGEKIGNNKWEFFARVDNLFDKY